MDVPDPADDWSSSGIVALTGRPDGPTIVPPGRAASVARELGAFLRTATERGDHTVDVDGRALLSERAAFTRWSRRGRHSLSGHTRLLPSTDGWVVAACARPDDPALLGALIERAVPEHDPWPQIEEWVAEHTSREFDERVELLGLAGGIVAESTPAPGVVPDSSAEVRSVEGAVVVDFSALWAGPLCAHLLGLAGARIVKVETPNRPDGARGGNPDFYRLLHGGHESVALDPAVPAQQAELFELVRRADIVIEASRPRALRRFGLDADAFVEHGTTWVSITARGRRSERIGFGDDIAVTSGLFARDPDGSPLFVGDAIADPLSGLAAAAAVLSSTSGTGRLVDISMSDVVRSTLQPGPGSPSEIFTTPLRRRTPRGEAPASGADTDTVLRGFGIRR